MDISVLCITYNHEKYIGKALDGFLMQRGDFEYEILVHDDASSDGTVNILKEYKEKYPGKITLILQKENQYSKGINILRTYFYPLIRGKYIAFCEGDDFWIYDGKLQKQYELMEANPNISLCYHNALIYQKESDILRLNVQNHPSGYIEDRDIINVTKGWYPTASIFCRTDDIKEQPDIQAGTGDETWRTYMACRGDLYFINRAWSVYTEFSEGGWNTRYYQDKKLAKIHFRKTVEYFLYFNRYSKERFKEYIKRRLFQGVDKYKSAHYGMECSVSKLRECLNDLKDITEHRIDQVLKEYYLIYAIGCIDYYTTTIKEQLGKKDNIYIYGVGNEAIKALVELDKQNLTPKGFLVSDRHSLPLKLLGIPVYEVEKFTFGNNKWIWPCLINGREEVLKILIDKGCKQIIV